MATPSSLRVTVVGKIVVAYQLWKKIASATFDLNLNITNNINMYFLFFRISL